MFLANMMETASARISTAHQQPQSVTYHTLFHHFNYVVYISFKAKHSEVNIELRPRQTAAEPTV